MESGADLGASLCKSKDDCVAFHEISSHMSEMNTKLTSIMSVLQFFFQSWTLDQQKLRPPKSMDESVSPSTTTGGSQRPSAPPLRPIHSDRNLGRNNRPYNVPRFPPYIQKQMHHQTGPTSLRTAFSPNHNRKRTLGDGLPTMVVDESQQRQGQMLAAILAGRNSNPTSPNFSSMVHEGNGQDNGTTPEMDHGEMNKDGGQQDSLPVFSDFSSSADERRMGFNSGADNMGLDEDIAILNNGLKVENPFTDINFGTDPLRGEFEMDKDVQEEPSTSTADVLEGNNGHASGTALILTSTNSSVNSYLDSLAIGPSTSTGIPRLNNSKNRTNYRQIPPKPTATTNYGGFRKRYYERPPPTVTEIRRGILLYPGEVVSSRALGHRGTLSYYRKRKSLTYEEMRIQLEAMATEGLLLRTKGRQFQKQFPTHPTLLDKLSDYNITQAEYQAAYEAPSMIY